MCEIPRPTSFKDMLHNSQKGSPLVFRTTQSNWWEWKQTSGIKNNPVSMFHILARKYKEAFTEAVKQMGMQLIRPLDLITTFALRRVSANCLGVR